MFKKKQKIRRNVLLERRKRQIWDKILKILFAISGILLLCFVLFSPFLKIKKIDVLGNNSIPSEKIEEEVKLTLKENILFLIPGDNIIFVSAKNSEKKIKEKFPEVKGVKIKKNWLDIKNPGKFKLEVKISEKEKKVVWCQECPFDRNNNNVCFYLDKEGRAFSPAENNPNKIEAIIIFEKPQQKVFNKNDESSSENKNNKEFQQWKIDCGKCGENNCFKEKKTIDGKENITCYLLPEICLNPISINDQVADRQFISFVLDLDEKLKQDSHFKIVKYQTGGVKTREIIAYTDRGLKLYFSTLESADSQIEYLKDFLKKGIDKRGLDSLEYIYLEAGDRIFYK